MSTKSGFNGKVMLGTSEIPEITSWKLDESAKIYDASSLGSKWTKNATGLLSWKGSAEGHYNFDATNAQDDVRTALRDGSDVALKLYVDATSYYTGSAKISDSSVETPVDGLVSFSFDFEGNGELTGPTTTTP